MALPHSLDPLRYPARYQFGQGGPCGGSSCCTDTCIQMIIEYYKERTYSLYDIRRMAQADTSFNEHPCTGINHIEVINALEAAGIYHYRVGYNVNYWDVWRYVEIGPVIVGVHYGSYPKSTNGRCGWTNRAEVGGKTDCPFRGAHAVLAVKKRYHKVNDVTHRDFYTRDPDHNSPSRPERPAYDIVKASQLSSAMKNLPTYTAFSNTYIVYPTRKKTL